MKKFGKKLMALAMASVMMCSSITAFATEVTDESAATGSSTGAGQLEGWADPNVFSVVLPTETTQNSTFAFTMDPQKLLHQTQASDYTDANATLFFGNKTNTSEALTATNKGNVKVDVSVTATVDADTLTDADKSYAIKVTDDKTFANDTTTSLYLGLIMGTDSPVPVDGKTLTVTATNTLDAVAADNFEPVKGADGKYKYQLKSGVADSAFKSVDFKMEGATNSNGNWNAVDDATTAAAPSVSVAWTLKQHFDDIVITKVASSAAPITVTTGKEVKSAAYVKLNGTASTAAVAAASYTVSGNSFTIASALAKLLTKGDTVIALTFVDGTTQTLTINVVPYADITISKAAASTDPITVTTAKTVASAQYVKLNGAANTAAVAASSYTVNGTSFTIASALTKLINKGDTVITLTFTDGTTQTLTISVK